MFELGEKVTLAPKSWDEFRDALMGLFARDMILDEFSTTHKEMILVAGVIYGEGDSWFNDLLINGGEIIKCYAAGWYMVNINGVKLKFHESVLCLKEDMRSIDEKLFINCLLL